MATLWSISCISPTSMLFSPTQQASSTTATNATGNLNAHYNRMMATMRMRRLNVSISGNNYDKGRKLRSNFVVCMAPEEEKMTRRSPLDFPIEWERPKPGRRPDIFPQFSPMKTPLPTPLPADPPEEDEEEEEKKEEEEEDPEKEEPEKPEKQ